LKGGAVARFEDLAVWKRSARLSAELYKSLKDLKDFGFRDQITRAGLSIPSNIAEGYERESAKETANFLNYAKGSAGELRTQLYIGMDIGYIERDAGLAWIREAEEISRMLHGLMQTIRTRKS
jgi:four helix bundle protein